jgi:hypothetical protein
VADLTLRGWQLNKKELKAAMTEMDGDGSGGEWACH